MTNITLPREVVEQVLEAMIVMTRLANVDHAENIATVKLRAALSAAAEPVKVEQSLFPNGIAHLIPPITMSVGQLRYAVLGMGGDDNETLLTFQHRLACKDMDGEDAPAGMVCWLHEYREEGSLHLPSDIAPPWPAVPDAAKPEQQTWEEACEASRQNFLAVAARIDDPSWEETGPEIRALAEKAVQQSEAAKFQALPKTQGEREELIERLNASANWLEHGVRPSDDVRLPSGPDLRKAAALLSAGPARVEPLTEREIELIDGMLEVQLNHAARCDSIANRTMADKQKGWDMERVELLRKLKASHGIGKDKAS